MTNATPRPIPFCEPFDAPDALTNVAAALATGLKSVSGRFSEQCRRRMAGLTGGSVLLTTSGSAALELALLVLRVGPGDEVILPSYTFTSVANAVALRGAVPVFVDIDPVTLNITAELVEQAISARTKAIIVVHYAGLVAEMEPIMALARARGLRVIEDAAHAIGSTRNGKAAGSFGDLAAFSFHYTKNVSCGEGGCLVVNDPGLVAATEVAFEKGTNRTAFINGLVDKYSWVSIGSSFTMSELNAAVLDAQLACLDEINQTRHGQWQAYATALGDDRAAERFAIARLGPGEGHNAHMFYLMLREDTDRAGFIHFMQQRAITTPFHYVPLHSAPAGRAVGRVAGTMTATEIAGRRLVRLPLFPGLGDDIDRVIEAVQDWVAGT